MSDKAHIWVATVVCCFSIFGITYGYVYFTKKAALCLVEAVKIHTQYQVPFDRVVELCK